MVCSGKKVEFAWLWLALAAFSPRKNEKKNMSNMVCARIRTYPRPRAHQRSLTHACRAQQTNQQTNHKSKATKKLFLAAKVESSH